MVAPTASFVTPSNGDDALAEHVAQLTEDFSGLRNIPVSLSGINDAAAYSLTIKNAGTGSKGLIIYAADGTTVLLQVDSAGVAGSATGGAAGPIVTTTGTQTLTNKTLTTPHFTTPVVDSGNLTLAASDVLTRRLIANQGTPLVNGDFAISAGWGSTGAVAAGVNATDQRGRFTVTPGGTGIVANPTVTLTYKDGAWPVAPMVLCQLVGGTGAGITVPMGMTYGTTNVVMQMFFTPVSGTTYTFAFQTMG